MIGEIDPVKLGLLAQEMDPQPFMTALSQPQMPAPGAQGPMMPPAAPAVDFNSVVNGPAAQKSGMPAGGLGNLQGFINMMQPQRTPAAMAAAVPRPGQLNLPSMPHMQGPNFASVIGRR